jgi:hypothetical protein
MKIIFCGHLSFKIFFYHDFALLIEGIIIWQNMLTINAFIFEREHGYML